jgi:transcriptional regulator with XRE-family HTH domain
MIRLGERIRAKRLLAGLTQAELANRAGLSSIALVELGYRKNPTIRVISAIATALGITIDELIGRNRKNRKSA